MRPLKSSRTPLRSATVMRSSSATSLLPRPFVWPSCQASAGSRGAALAKTFTLTACHHRWMLLRSASERCASRVVSRQRRETPTRMTSPTERLNHNGRERHRRRPRSYDKVPARRYLAAGYRVSAPCDRRLGREAVGPGQPGACRRSQESRCFKKPSGGRQLRLERRGAASYYTGHAGAGGSQRACGDAGGYGKAHTAEHTARTRGGGALRSVDKAHIKHKDMLV